MKGSYFIPTEKLKDHMKGAAMNSQEGVYLMGRTDPDVKRLLPPPLELNNPDQPEFYIYVVNIREPTFSPWYMEGGLGVLAKYQDKVGVYFLSLMLSGPGAFMGAMTGRESSGLPKKLCEKILVERTDDCGRCVIERNGARLLDLELEFGGKYNDPDTWLEQENCHNHEGGQVTEGGCLLHKYHQDMRGKKVDFELIYYDSPTRYYSWEPATAACELGYSIDDPWSEITVRDVIWAGWARNDNFVRKNSSLYRYPEEEWPDLMQYLYTGRYDRCLLCREHQRYQ